MFCPSKAIVPGVYGSAINLPDVHFGRGYLGRFAVLVLHQAEEEETERYLLKDYFEILMEANQLRKAGDRDAWVAWADERVNSVKAWRKKTTPLVEWMIKWKSELKLARAKEIKTRLLELGWELIDIQNGHLHSSQWNTFVNKAKILDNKEWNNELPNLLDGVGYARSKRLRLEAHRRREARNHHVKTWLQSLPETKLNITLCKKDSNKLQDLDLMETSAAVFHSEDTEKQNVTIQVNLYPNEKFIEHSGLNDQSHFHALLDKDQPMEDFQLELRDKRASIEKQLHKDWSRNLEAALVKKLPRNLAPVNIEGSDFYLQVHIGTEDISIVDAHRLVPNFRELLRADILLGGGAYNFGYFPHTCDDWSPTGCAQYNDKVSAIARALLSTLQRPNASFLEMRALGNSFLCGRCTGEPVYRSWEDILAHYSFEGEYHKKACRLKAHYSKYSTSLNAMSLVPIHDLSKVDIEKPLVRFVAKRDQIQRTETSTSSCLLCFSIDHIYITDASQIEAHVREVHLIELPVLGEHYRIKPLQTAKCKNQEKC
ncbi:unnamed protein product [Rhizoctonia solani]|uniref:Uncharacterized protein n=1 Tax=Rhizoctonia solani TaxID=456999 RepID=A0A8H3BBK8_9AGAM|nr:unnamed protein product [Rhizoctonia solani]